MVETRSGRSRARQAKAASVWPPKKSDGLRTLAVAASLLALPGAALADKNWNTAVEVGDWNVPANWVENAVPTSSDNVNIIFDEPALHSVTLNTDFSSSLGVTLDNKSNLTSTSLVVGTGFNFTVGTATIAPIGTARIAQSGGTVTVNGIETVGDGGFGSVLQTGGTHNVGTPTVTGELHIAQQQGSMGTYNLNDGMLLAQFEQIGLSGTGLFLQNGGVNETTYGPNGGGTFSVGDSPLGSGAYVLAGGTLSCGGELWGYRGQAIMNQSGGFHQSGGIVLGVDGAATYSQTGGVTQTNSLYIGYGSQPGIYALSGTGELDLFGSAYVGGNYSAPMSTGVLLISSGSVVMQNGDNSVIMVYANTGTTLSVSGSGKIDLTTAGLIQATTDDPDKTSKIGVLDAAIVKGSNGGNWTGTGITSSTAAADKAHYGVGIFDNALLSKASVHGLALDSGSILVIIAHLGDANDNGVVDIQDQSLITNNWQQPRKNWAAGDLNLDGFVDIQDLTIVTNNWQQNSIYSQSAGDAGGLPVVPVPEPGALAVLWTGTAVLLGRKKRRG